MAMTSTTTTTTTATTSANGTETTATVASPDPFPGPEKESGDRVVVHRPTGGLRYNYGLQAIVDMYMAKRMIADRGQLTVKMTFLPMIRLAADDPEEVEREYMRFRSQNEQVRPWDSPRERWRKYYGNFVREMEWALLKLREQFTPAQYEEVVVGTLAALSRIDSGREIEFMNGRIQKGRAERESNAGGQKEESALSKMVMKVVDPSRFAGFLVGESEITEINEETGEAVMEVPNCAWHTCPDPDALPKPGVLPEQGCLLICKGVFERIFDGSGGLEMRFDPHLPETSCTIRIRF